MVQCAGCGSAVSEWAAQCPECGADLNDARPLESSATESSATESSATEWSAPFRLRRLISMKAVAAAGVLVAGLAAMYLSGNEPSTSGEDRETTTASSAASRTPAPVKIGVGPRRGQIAYADPARRLLRIADLRTGGSVALELPVEPYPERLFALGASFVLVARGEAWIVGALDVGSDATTSARPLGPAESVLPADQPGGVWLIRGSPPHALEALLVSGTGEPLAAPVHLPADTVPVVAVGPQRLVLQRTDGTLLPFDTRAGRLTEGLGRPGDVLDAHGPHVAWVTRARGECVGDEPCYLHLTDLESGTDRMVEPPSGSTWIRGGSFSPDGSTLAAFASVDDGASPPSHARLVIVDLATVGAVAIPRSEVPLGEPVVAAAWSNTSGWLLYSGLEGSMRAHFRGSRSAVALDLPASYTFAAN